MENTQYIALSKQTVLWKQLSMIGNNLANMNTPGFKQVDPLFDSYLAVTKSEDKPLGERIAYVHDFGIVRDFNNGELSATGNPLDMAIHGDAFFALDHERFGEVYSRNGRFQLNKDGMMVTADGHAVMGENNQPVFIAPNEKDVSVARDGTISTENGVVGRLKVVRFQDNQKLREYYGGLFGTDVEANPPVPNNVAAIEQGYVEQSNVKPVMEITKMIDVQRSYEGVQRLIESENTRRQKAMDAFARKGNR